MRNHPVRDWRDITLWLKWGLLISVLTSFLKVWISADPTTASYVISGFDWLNNYHDTINIPLPLQYALFFIIETLSAVVLWLLKSLVLLLGYQLFEEIHFDETNIAFSLAGASMVTNVWHILPYGTIIAALHAFVLIAYLGTQIHDIPLSRALVLGVAGLLPFIY
jgi:hypothetical protein